MALAGCERIFALLDEKPETDNGYVTLVNSVEDENGNIKETDIHTGHGNTFIKLMVLLIIYHFVVTLFLTMLILDTMKKKLYYTMLIYTQLLDKKLLL